MKRIMNLTLLIIWMIVIFLFSSASSNKSIATSDKVINTGITITESISGNKTSNEVKEKTIDDLTFIVRKLAHFTEYVILGILMINCLKDYNLKKVVLISIILCVLYACSDEIHQYFVGRTARVFDVFIDSLGSIVGIFVYKKTKFLSNKRI